MNWWRKFPRVRTRTVLFFATLMVGSTVVITHFLPFAESVQRGARGTAMVQVYDAKALAAQAAVNAMPEIPPPARVRPNAPKAGAAYKNVQVLGDLSISEFGRTMNSITAWVAPAQSCSYCHVDGDFAADSKYTKLVARRMLQMVRNVNANWSTHVGATGVTCYTCHRGNNLPTYTWFRPPAPQEGRGLLGDRAGQNAPAAAVGLASLPGDPFSAYLQSPADAQPIRVAGTTALQTGNRHSIKQAEFTYGLMTHMSKSLGVNCTYCHNSRSFGSWEQSSPQRVTAWYGLRMVRELNGSYLDPLGRTFPAIPLGRLGPSGDAAKVNCNTCHQGAFKPMYGAQMAKHFPGLWAPAGEPAVSAAASAVAPASAPASAASEPSAQPAAPAASDIELMARAASTPASAVVVAVALTPPVAPALVSASAPAATPARASCAASADAAGRQGAVVAGARVVIGAGRLQFFQAPDAGCAMPGIFILSGEPVVAAREHRGFTAVRYRHPRTGVETTGWVDSARLAFSPP